SHLPVPARLQDDYHKLLTKYAEAENTIDQLRLGAKVSLYADPPRPSHSVHVGTLGTSSKVMAFSIPRVRTAAISTAPVPALQPSLCGAQGPVHQGTSPRPGSPPFPAMGCSACPGECGCQGQHPCPSTRLTQTLAGQTRKFQAQASWVESFEAWVRAGMSTPQEQLQRFRKLKDTQDALERTYLQAREENRGLQQHPDASGEFDPDRVVEGEIFCLGLRLEELKDRLERAARGRRCLRSCSDPALQEMLPSSRPGTGVSSASGESDAGEEEPPQPLWHKRLQVEEDFGDLLEQYKHFKSLPESLSLEQLSLGGSQSPEEVDGLVAGELGKVPCRTPSPEESSDLHTSPSDCGCPSPDEAAVAMLPLGTSSGRRSPYGLRWVCRATCCPGAPCHRGVTWGCRLALGDTGALGMTLRLLPATAELPSQPCCGASRGTAVGPGASSEVSRACVSPRLSQLLPPVQEQRMVSPETDSGFVGSEASRVSPLMPVPEQRSPHAGTPGSLGRSGPVSRAATLRPLQTRAAAPLRSEKAPTGAYRTRGHGPRRDGVWGPGLPPSTPSQSSSLAPWADGVTSETAPDAAGSAATQGLPSCRWLCSPEHPLHCCSPGTPSSPAHTDSAPEERSRGSCHSHPPGKSRGPAGPATTTLSPDRAHRDLLGSRMERDRAIRALQDEVSRLQRRLEESLHRPRSHPGGRAPLQTARARSQTVGNGLSPEDPAPS
ncbi:AKNA factor, partial [Eudromia elegans]|nr:AKNA factor [Eudromia elegans]